MYELIQAEERHIEQLVPLLASTGYWDFGLKNNKLNLSNRAFMKEAIVKPYLPFTEIIVTQKDDETVLGTVVSATKKALSTMALTQYDASIDPRIAHLFQNIFSFEITESYHISFLAVSKAFRGRGLGRRLLEHAEKMSKQAGCDTLSLYTVNCQISAIKLYHQFGMMITKVINISDQIPFPHFLYFEKNIKLMAQHDYFETEEYQQLDLADLLKDRSILL